MRRPNGFDWLVYQIFRWWWNPIFEHNRIITATYVISLCMWLEKKWNVTILDESFKQPEKGDAP